MSDEDETFNDDVEFQNTQREIEELRRKEEELMLKMNAIANKRKSASYNSLEGDDTVEEVAAEEVKSDEEDEEGEKIGQRRKPSLSRGSSKSSDTSRKRPGSIEVESELTFSKSRSNRSSIGSPTKEDRLPSSQNSRSSSRTSLTSPTKVYSTTVTIRQGRGSSTTSPTKSDSGKLNSLHSSGEIVSAQTKQRKVTSKGKMARSYSTPDGKTGKSPRGSKTDLRKSPVADKTGRNRYNRRSFPNDSIEGIEDQGRSLKKKGESSSTTNLSNAEVPENSLVDRGMRGSRSSSKDGRSRTSLHINDDSYEIIEIEDEDDSSSMMSKDSISIREKIEQELAEQKQREEELKLHHGAASNIEPDEERDEEASQQESDIDEGRGEDIEELSDEDKQGEKTEALSTWEKIALEIEEEKKREEEVRRRSLKEEEDKDSGEEDDDNISEEDKNDVSVKINSEIEEQKRREDELKRTALEDRNGVTSSEEGSSEDEQTKLVSVQDRIEIEIKEIEKREKELKKKYNIEESNDIAEGGMEGEESMPSDSAARSKIQQEIDDFRKKESEFRMLHGVEESGGSDEDEDESFRPGGNSLSIIEREIAEQKKKELEYRKTHRKTADPEETPRDDENENGEEIDEIPEDESMLLRQRAKVKSKSPDKSPRAVGNSEYNVAPGITKKFIHMFNKGVDQPVVKKQETNVISKKEEKTKMNGQGDKGSDEEEDEEHDVSEEEDSCDDASNGDGNDLDGKSEEDEFIDRKETTSIHAPAPGKKLVLKKKKSKGKVADDTGEEQHEESPVEQEHVAKLISKSPTQRSKESKPVKKPHPLAMQWEQIQAEKRREADKNDIDARRREQESERRKKQEQRDKLEQEKQKQKQEIRELQDKRKGLAESWEKKNQNNNNEAVKTNKSIEVKVSPVKDAAKAKSPRKSPTKQESRKGPQTPKSARANIKLWEQRIASSQSK